MMKFIRRWVYAFGYRPSPGSIFFSPSFVDLAKARVAIKAASQLVENGWLSIDEVRRVYYCYFEKEQEADMVNSELRDMEKAQRLLAFCPMCAEELERHPITGNWACFAHGDFVVQASAGKVRIEFKMVGLSK